jgi:hypothetical protein
MGPQLSRPGSITGAAVLWIIYGSLGTLGGLISLQHPNGPAIGGFAIAVAFLVTGIQALMGKARGMLGSGIGSIIWGVVVLIAFLALGSIIRGARGLAGIFAIIGLVFGGILITAGILACVGNGKYKAWRASTGK